MGVRAALSAGVPSAITSPAVEHGHDVRHAHHDVHVVLDEQHGDPRGADPLDQRVSRRSRVGLHPGDRLVEQHQLGIGRQRPCDLEPPLVAERQAAGELPLAPGQPDEREKPQCAVADAPFLAAERGRGQQRPDETGAGAGVSADDHVLEDGHPPPDLAGLERSGDAEPTVRRCAGRRIDDRAPEANRFPSRAGRYR